MIDDAAWGGDPHEVFIFNSQVVAMRIHDFSDRCEIDEHIRIARRNGAPVPMLKKYPSGDLCGLFVSGFSMSDVITVGQWNAVVGGDDYLHSLVPSLLEGLHLGLHVTFDDAVRYCNCLSAIVGLPPAYVQTSRGYGWSVGPGFRLPTEVEWIFALSPKLKLILDGVGSNRLFDREDYMVRLLQDEDQWRRSRGRFWEWCWDSVRIFGRIVQWHPPEKPRDYDSRVVRSMTANGQSMRDKMSSARLLRFRVVSGLDEGGSVVWPTGDDETPNG